MRKKKNPLTEEESKQEFFEWLYRNNDGFRREYDEHMSMIHWLTIEQVNIIIEHSKISDEAEFGINFLGETFAKLSDGVVKITTNEKRGK